MKALMNDSIDAPLQVMMWALSIGMCLLVAGGAGLLAVAIKDMWKGKL